MTEIRDFAHQSLDTFNEVLDASVAEDVVFTGPAQEYAALILTRLKAAFEAMALFLKSGYLDEAVVLTRRHDCIYFCRRGIPLSTIGGHIGGL